MIAFQNLPKLFDLFFPPLCCVCHYPGDFLCGQCYEDLDFLTLPVQLRLEKNYLDLAIAAVDYQLPITAVIQEMKYRHGKNIGKWCGWFLFMTTYFPLTDLMTFVPLHPSRLAERGFNQAEIMTEELSRFTSISVISCLQRVKNNRHQATITEREQRLANLENTFAMIRGREVGILGKSILLIDDVMTTGTTLNECAKVLKANGAKKVIALTVAHGN